MPEPKHVKSRRSAQLKSFLDGRPLASVRARYAAAFLVVTLAIALRVIVMQSLGPRLAYLTFYPAVMAAAMLGGRGPAVLTALISAGFVALWWSPSGNVVDGDLLDWVGMAIFLGCSMAIAAFAGRAHRNYWRLRNRTDELSKANDRLQEEVCSRESMEARLKASEERFRLAASSDGITLYEQDETLRYRWLYPEKQGHASVLGRTDAEIQANEDGADLSRWKREVMASGEAQRRETRVLRSDGVRYFDIFITPRRDATGRIVGVAGTALEITRRKLREQNRQVLAAIVESSEDAILAIDLEGTITSWNRGAMRLFGYTPEEAVGCPVTLLIPPERHAEEPGILQRIRRGERIDHYETRRRRKDGTELDISLAVSPLRDEDGEIVGASKIARDVSARNRAERNRQFLASLNERLASQENPDVILQLASQLVGEHLHVQRCAFAEWNEETGYATIAQEWRALTRTTLDGIHVMSVCGPAKWSPRLATGITVEDVEAEPALVSFIERYRTFEVRAFAISGYVRKAPWRVSLVATVDQPRSWCDDELQLLNNMVERVWPLVERARSEKALRASERQLRLITDHAPVSLAHLNRERRFKFVNQTFARRFGRETSEIVGAHVAEVIGAEAFQRVQPYLDAAFDGRHVEFETEVPFPDLGLRWVHAICTPEFMAEGYVAGVIALISDVTARKEAERDVALARDQALAASRAKDDFLAALSHELRTPLNPVLLIASESAENPLLPAEVRHDFATIRKNVELEARLIDDLLDVTRITHGKLPLDLRAVNGDAILQDALSVIRPEAEQKRITLALDLAAQHTAVRGDAVRLQQVLWNVLKNAVKFTPAGGRIEVRSDLSETDSWRVIVRDSGIGMTPAELARVFDAFAQGDHAAGLNSHRFGGLGLGLTISRMVVELHCGSIRAESAGPGEGATFVVELPVLAQAPVDTAPGEPPAHSWADRARSAHAPRRVLLVEDHSPTREALASLLRRRGFDVLTAGSIAEARSRLAEGGIDLLISDIGLPDGDGCDLMAEVRDQAGLRGVALTGYGMEADIARTAKVGFAAHLTKPIRVQALDAALAAVLASAGEPVA